MPERLEIGTHPWQDISFQNAESCRPLYSLHNGQVRGNHWLKKATFSGTLDLSMPYIPLLKASGVSGPTSLTKPHTPSTNFNSWQFSGGEAHPTITFSSIQLCTFHERVYLRSDLNWIGTRVLWGTRQNLRSSKGTSNLVETFSGTVRSQLSDVPLQYLLLGLHLP